MGEALSYAGVDFAKSGVEGSALEESGGSSEDTIKVPTLELAEELDEEVKCVLCGRMTKHVVRGGGTFVVCAGECQ
jgi:hypothetical protein